MLPQDGWHWQTAQAPCHRDGMLLAASCFCARFCGVRSHRGTLEHFASARGAWIGVGARTPAAVRARPASGVELARPPGRLPAPQVRVGLDVRARDQQAERRGSCRGRQEEPPRPTALIPFEATTKNGKEGSWSLSLSLASSRSFEREEFLVLRPCSADRMNSIRLVE